MESIEKKSMCDPELWKCYDVYVVFVRRGRHHALENLKQIFHLFALKGQNYYYLGFSLVILGKPFGYIVFFFLCVQY